MSFSISPGRDTQKAPRRSRRIRSKKLAKFVCERSWHSLCSIASQTLKRKKTAAWLSTHMSPGRRAVLSGTNIAELKHDRVICPHGEWSKLVASTTCHCTNSSTRSCASHSGASVHSYPCHELDRSGQLAAKDASQYSCATSELQNRSIRPHLQALSQIFSIRAERTWARDTGRNW